MRFPRFVMRTLVFTGLTLPLCASFALAQTPPLVPASPLAPLPTPLPTPTPAPRPRATGTNAPPVDYPGAIWTPAAEGNFDYENRPNDEDINMVVVHDIEGPASAGISIFQTKGANVTAHYIVGGDGKVYQLVREHNVAWHAGNRTINHHAIGIETHGYAYRPGWYNATIYEAEAKLIRNITTRYNIPRDRKHIIGHFEVPDPRDPTKFGGAGGHTDPGPFWDWDSFMTLVRNDAKLVSMSAPPVIRPGEVLPVTVSLQNTGDDSWYANTAKSIYAVESNGPVAYLTTLEGKQSPLSSVKGWVSPVVAAGTALADVAPGATSTYAFTLTGPTQLGAYTEPLRLGLFPKMAQGGRPVSFGDTVDLTTRVVPYDLTIPAPDAPSATTPTSPVAAPAATWTLALPVGGIYAVYATPPKPLGRIKGRDEFVYALSPVEGPKTRVLSRNWRKTELGTAFLGYFNFPAPTPGAPTTSVKLVSAPRSIPRNDLGSLRFIGPFPTAPTTPVVSASALAASTGATAGPVATATSPTTTSSPSTSTSK